MKTAQDLWHYIKTKAEVKTDLVFWEDKGIAEGAYVIDGNLITHNSGVRNPAAIYAVARLSQELFKAEMTGETIDSIVLTPNVWRDLQIVYTPRMVRNNYVNTATNSLFLWWNHVPTIGSGGSNFHRSWFLGLCFKYKQLSPEGEVREDTKPDITHPDFPEIIYKEWELRGKPDICSLFEIDGTEYWWVNKHISTPSYLNQVEKERFEITLLNSLPGIFHVGSTMRARLDGIRYPITENINWARQLIPRDNNNRYNYTAFYLKVYKDVQAYFDKMGATHVIFNVLAYSAYRCCPENMQVDLSRFHVYYTPTFRGNNTTKELVEWDIPEVLKWKTTGAKVICRMNFPFEKKGNGSLFADYVNACEFDGMQVPPFVPENITDYVEYFKNLK